MSTSNTRIQRDIEAERKYLQETMREDFFEDDGIHVINKIESSETPISHSKPLIGLVCSYLFDMECVLNEIDEENITLGNKIANKWGLQSYRGLYKPPGQNESIGSIILKFDNQDQFLNTIRILRYIKRHNGGSAYYLSPIGMCISNAQIILRYQEDYTLDKLYPYSWNNGAGEANFPSALTRYKILLEVAKAVKSFQGKHRLPATTKKNWMGDSLRQRDLRSGTILISEQFVKSELRKKTGVDFSTFSIKLADVGVGRIFNDLQSCGDQTDIWVPPEGVNWVSQNRITSVDGEATYTEEGDAWKFGCLAYEVWTQTSFDNYFYWIQSRVVINGCGMKNIFPRWNLNPQEKAKFDKKEAEELANSDYQKMKKIYKTLWMSQPEQGGPHQILYELIEGDSVSPLKCWDLNPKNRPSFDRIVTQLEKLCAELEAEEKIKADKEVPKQQDKAPTNTVNSNQGSNTMLPQFNLTPSNPQNLDAFIALQQERYQQLQSRAKKN